MVENIRSVMLKELKLKGSVPLNRGTIWDKIFHFLESARLVKLDRNEGIACSKDLQNQCCAVVLSDQSVFFKSFLRLILV